MYVLNSRSEFVNELATALAKAQNEMDVASLNKQNPFFKSRYADFMSIVSASRPALTKYGLSVLQNILTYDDGQTMLHTVLLHASGQFFESRIKVIPPKNDIQSMSSYITYLKRLSYASLVGVVVGDEDDDGEAAVVDYRTNNTKSAPIKEPVKETISQDQIDTINYKLESHPAVADALIALLEKTNRYNLSDIYKKDYLATLNWIEKNIEAEKGNKESYANSIRS